MDMERTKEANERQIIRPEPATKPDEPLLHANEDRYVMYPVR